MIINFSEKQKMKAEDKQACTAIIKEAFWGKMRILFGDIREVESLLLIEEAITFSKGFYYVKEGKVLAVAILSTEKLAYFTIGKAIRKSMGLWKSIVLGIMFGTLSKASDGLFLQMFATASEARGQGVGNAMLQHLFSLAKEEGLEKITLEVIDSNMRAKRLYEQEGFVTIKYVSLALLHRIIGFKGYYKMQKSLT